VVLEPDEVERIRERAHLDGFKAGAASLFQWVMETDSLPEPGSLVVVATTGLVSRYWFGHVVDGQWQLDLADSDIVGEPAVTHWLDFPDAPEEKGQQQRTSPSDH
jgi:hypothetical protein